MHRFWFEIKLLNHSKHVQFILYSVVYVKVILPCFKPESHFVKFTAHIKKRSPTSMPEKNKLVSSANMSGFSYSEHL